MKALAFALISLLILIIILFLYSAEKNGSYCLVGAFLADQPTKGDIQNFKNNYGKKPSLVMVFIDWGHFVEEKVVKDVYEDDCVLFVTWEPWQAVSQEAIDYEELLSGKWDAYITEFADRFKRVNKTVFMRFAHEMNGDWYPWAGKKLGKDKYIAIYKYVKDIFDERGAANVKWVFSVNWEDVPGEDNFFLIYYPGDEYADFVGIDGYNWGNTKSWSRWMSFKEIFNKRYNQVIGLVKKPVLISEFSSTSKGGDKAIWIKEAMNDIKRMKKIKAFVLFNVDKETDWRFPPGEACGRELKLQLKDSYFKENFILK